MVRDSPVRHFGNLLNAWDDDVKRLWLVRLGRNGEFETDALDKSLLSIGFNMAIDLSTVRDRDAVLGIIKTVFPDAKPGSQANFAAQVNQFVNTMAVGDIVVSPLKTLSKIGISEVTGPYRQLENGLPARPIKWLATDIPRDAFKQDLLYSFGAIMTVCEVQRNDALKRVLAVAKGGKDPGDGAVPKHVSPAEAGVDDEIDQAINLEQIARDQIERRISSVFTGHEFTNLIAAILTAQGYETNVSPPGPDSGIDIVAGRGTLGFEAPRLVVQVKSGDAPVDQPTLQSLIGCVQDAHADHGLLVSWSGFKPTVRKRTNELYFRVRFWGREEVISALLSVYDKLPEGIRAELPLRRTWTLVPIDEEVGT
jgi:restriction system protein